MQPTILIIEDNEQNLYLARFILQQHGYTTLEARDGPTGIAAAEQHHPSLVLLDIQLPEMDGYAVARHLREISSLNKMPIVAVTSYAMMGDREQVLASGCDGYIEKPINPETFIQEIQSYLHHPRDAS